MFTISEASTILTLLISIQLHFTNKSISAIWVGFFKKNISLLFPQPLIPSMSVWHWVDAQYSLTELKLLIE